MKDFIIAAMPWLITGLALAILAANAVKKKGNNSDMGESTYLTAGMCIGTIIGVVVWIVFNNTYGLGLGMLAGETVGSCFKRKGNKNGEHH